MTTAAKVVVRPFRPGLAHPDLLGLGAGDSGALSFRTAFIKVNCQAEGKPYSGFCILSGYLL